MTWTIQRIRSYVLLAVLLAGVSVAANKGCELFFPEATFKLADNSRLPKWVTLPPGITRTDILLTMSYYVKPWGMTAQIILQDKNKQIIKKEAGKVSCRAPIKVKNSLQGASADYPSYEVITINGITEIIEHKKMEPIFYITDDPAVWKQYTSIGCG